MAGTEAEVVRDLAMNAGQPNKLERGHRYAWLHDGELVEADLSDDMPARRSGTVTVRDVVSFAHYFGKHADDDSEVFADLDKATVTAVLDAHHGAEYRPGDNDGYYGPARWQQHRVVLALSETKPWQTWVGLNGKAMKQQAFAEFLEDNRRDLDPGGVIKPADFLELAQSFHATMTAEFGSGIRLSTGETELTYKETTEARAGRTRKIEIPTEFALAIKPFDDCPASLIGARFRYRPTPDGAVFMYVLDDPVRHREEAVKNIVDRIQLELEGRPVMLGQPA
jgi:uncharacterized protein YfdQ (DUF2303 family)